ncbi:MAG: hypothetical protein K9I85_00550 [Saprospiraceae bacterium]|nr:hypothetical protein [Saprospiraceae bacterium]
MMIRTAKKYALQLTFLLILGISVALIATSMLPSNQLVAQVEIVDVPLQESEQTRSFSPESLILSAAKAIIHALLPSS